MSPSVQTTLPLPLQGLVLAKGWKPVTSSSNVLGLEKKETTALHSTHQIPGNQSLSSHKTMFSFAFCSPLTCISESYSYRLPFCQWFTQFCCWYWISQLPERESNVSFSKVKSITVIIFQFELILRTAFARRENKVAFYNGASLTRAPDGWEEVRGAGGWWSQGPWGRSFMRSGYIGKHEKQWLSVPHTEMFKADITKGL